MAVLVRMQDGGNGDPLREVHIGVGNDHARQGFAVGAHLIADTRREVRQPLRILLHREQEGDGAHYSPREYDFVGREHLVVAALE